MQDRIGAWMRAARAWHDWQGAKFCRFGDNMREVAVTEGDKVAAEMQFGFAVNGYGVGDLAAAVDAVPDAEAKALAGEYEERYEVAPELRRGGARHESLRDGARIELGLRAFLERGGFKGFTTTFEDLHGLKQLPGLAAAAADGRRLRLRRRGRLENRRARARDESHGRGAARRHLVHGGLHLPSRRPTAIRCSARTCWKSAQSIAAGKPSLEIHPLGIGGKEDPVRLVFDAPAGPALNAEPDRPRQPLPPARQRSRRRSRHPPLPKLPVARAVWECRPDFKTACAAWIYAGGAHHTGFSYSVTTEMLEDFATIAGIELVMIGTATRLSAFEAGSARPTRSYYHLAHGFRA